MKKHKITTIIGEIMGYKEEEFDNTDAVIAVVVGLFSSVVVFGIVYFLTH